ncbi:hypothetical protein BDZ89DRAFT_564385 [Hymenopellis radicata]|nr:hypothetical protein BDZ89DRAFT_564385 [Hymenopellis radicata]
MIWPEALLAFQNSPFQLGQLGEHSSLVGLSHFRVNASLENIFASGPISPRPIKAGRKYGRSNTSGRPPRNQYKSRISFHQCLSHLFTFPTPFRFVLLPTFHSFILLGLPGCTPGLFVARRLSSSHTFF